MFLPEDEVNIVNNIVMVIVMNVIKLLLLMVINGRRWSWWWWWFNNFFLMISLWYISSWSQSRIKVSSSSLSLFFLLIFPFLILPFHSIAQWMDNHCPLFDGQWSRKQYMTRWRNHKYTAIEEFLEAHFTVWWINGLDSYYFSRY